MRFRWVISLVSYGRKADSCKKDMRLQKYPQSGTNVLGTVLQYSYFSVISQFPLKIVHPLRNFLAVLPPPQPIQSWNAEKKSGYKRPTLFVGWGERLNLCEFENAPETQKCSKTFVHDCRFVWVWPQLDLLQVDLSKVLESERSELQCMRSPFRLNGFEIYYKLTRGKNDWHKLCRELHEISLTVLLVNCHDVTDRILERRISRQTGMKSPLKWPNQPEKRKDF